MAGAIFSLPSRADCGINGWVFARPGSSGAVRRTPSQHQHHRRRARGRALGALFVKAGHRVMFSSRHPDTLKGLADELGPLARAGTIAEAVEFGDVVMMVVPYTAV